MIFESTHKTLVFIAYAQILKPPLNDLYDVICKARGLHFGPCLHLLAYFVYASLEASGESADLHRLDRTCVAQQLNG